MINGFRICGVRFPIGQIAANKAYTPRRRTEGWGRTGAGVLWVGRGKGLDVVVLPKRSVFRFGNCF
jgi:hypothetical protein